MGMKKIFFSKGKNLILCVLMIFTMIGLFPIMAEGAAPASTYISSYLAGISYVSPLMIAIDSKGRLYVTDSFGRRVLILNNSGSLLSTINIPGAPVGIAVDSSGKIYVGSYRLEKKKVVGGNVRVFAPDGSFLYKLGSGDGEFGIPGDIAVSSTTGNIYVADGEANKVKVYYPDGSFAFGFGGVGSANGKFGGLNGIAINDGAREVIVSDWNNENANKARIQIFDLNGTYKRYFFTYTSSTYYFTKLEGLAVDKEGRIYVVDIYQGSVQVFSSSGASLGLVGKSGQEPGYLLNPVGVAIDPDNKLFITSHNTGRIEVFGLDTYNALKLEPENMSFTGDEGGSNPPSQTLKITNNGNGTMNWTATTDTDNAWLSVSPDSGAAPSDAEVSVNIMALTAGTYTGAITITTASGVKGTVSIKLTVNPSPAILRVIPLELSFSARVNGINPLSKDVLITNLGSGALGWKASAPAPWITIDKTSGDAPSSLSVSVNNSGLDAGTYSGSVVIEAPGARNSPQAVTVTLTLIRAGTLNVTANTPDATFTLSGPETYTGTGTSWAQENAPEGAYTITFGNVKGMRTPPSQSDFLPTGSSVMFEGTYRPWRVVDSIVVGKGEGPKNAALINIFDKNGSITGSFSPFTGKYGAKVATGDVDGDGIDEIISAPGGGPDNGALVVISQNDGAEKTSFIALSSLYGATVSAGDMDNDGIAEIVVGGGPGPEAPAEVRVFKYSDKGIIDTGIDFIAFDSSDTMYGVNIALADIDGDWLPELITTPGPDPNIKGEVKIWKIDTSEGAGRWKVTELNSFTGLTTKYGARVVGADLNADGIDEIILGAGPGPKNTADVKVFNGDGTPYGVSFVAGDWLYGVNISAGDFEDDKKMEIVVSPGNGPQNKGAVKVFDSSGNMVKEFEAFSDKYGANPSVGRFAR